MDNTRFREQLIDLNNRVTELSSTRFHSPRTSDPVIAGLGEVKTRLNAMENNLMNNDSADRSLLRPAPSQSYPFGAPGPLRPKVNSTSEQQAPSGKPLFTTTYDPSQGYHPLPGSPAYQPPRHSPNMKWVPYSAMKMPLYSSTQHARPFSLPNYGPSTDHVDSAPQYGPYTPSWAEQNNVSNSISQLCPPARLEPTPSNPNNSYMKLRQDVDTLMDRFPELEKTVSELEDKFDNLDPNRFTPPESAVSSHTPFVRPANLWNVTRDTERLDLADPREIVGTIPSGSNADVQSKPAKSLYDLLGSDPDIAHSQLSEAEICAQLDSLNDSIRRLAPPKEDELFEIYIKIDALKDLIRRLPQEAENFPANWVMDTAKRQMRPMGVVYRDREIERLDDQVRLIRDQLTASEKCVAEKEAIIAEHEETLANNAAVLTELEEKVAAKDTTNLRLEEELGKKDSLIADIRHLRNAADDRIHSLLKQRSDLKEDLRQGNNHLEENAHLRRELRDKSKTLRVLEDDHSRLEYSFREASGRMQAFDEVLRKERDGYQREVRKLRDLCKEKEETIINGGLDADRQKGEEIKDLRYRLSAAEEGKARALKTAEKTAWMLDARDTELELLKSAMKAAPIDELNDKVEPTEQPTEEQPNQEDRDEQAPSSMSAHVRNNEVSPPTLKSYQDGPDNSITRSGQSSNLPKLPRRDQGPAWFAEVITGDSNRNRYYDKSIPTWSNEFAPSNGSEAAARTLYRAPSEPSIRHGQGRPRDVTHEHPPHHTARRMASAADLQRPRLPDRPLNHNNLSRHQSMQQLPRRRLQAYVESEEEVEGGL